ncbi:hypothetical protein O1B89_000834 [Vibrio cholerae]|nr:hypothetical protein [Vibrio cholerae]EKF9420464.1 hypothetical protein [Vibrio cholerae]
MKSILATHFSDCQKTLTEISANNCNGDISNLFYLSKGKLYCMDSIVKKHFKIIPKSADAIAITDKIVVFIEFKDGKKDNIKTHDIKLKLFEAFNALFKVLNDKTASQISRKDFWDMDFFYLVIYRDDEKIDSILPTLNRSEIKWGLDDYKGLYLKGCFTEFSPDIVKDLLCKIGGDAFKDTHYILKYN